IDSDRNAGPAPGSFQSAQPMCDRVRAVVVEAETIYQRALLGEAKDPRLWISRLCPGGYRADLDETKTESGPRRQRQTILIQAGGQADWIWEIQAEEVFRIRFWLKTLQPAKNRPR